MNWQPNFQRLTEESRKIAPILTDPRSPLILVKASGVMYYARLKDERLALLKDFYHPEDVLLFPWSGQWRTEVFRLFPEDVAPYMKVRI
jgi:hypothetical protein